MSWFQLRRASSVKRQTRPGNRINFARLGVEGLEDRLTPSTTNLSGNGVLANATLQAAVAPNAVVVAPATPSVLGPIGNINTALPKLTWSASAGATSYQLWLAPTGQQNPVINLSGLTTTSYTPQNALAPGSYNMWVRAFNSVGTVSAWSASKTFSVAPNAPTVLSPIGNINTQLPTFTWTAPPAAASYQLWVQATGQTTPVINVTNLTTTSYTATQSLAPGSYTMWVRDFGSTGQPSLWSASKTFSVAPNAPTLLAPIGTISTQLPKFTWTAPVAAASYQLWVQPTGINTPLINVTGLTTTSYTATQKLAPGSYTMWVRDFSSTGQASLWSASKTFTVAAPAPVVNLGQQVVAFGKSKLGTTVGGGECTDLVTAALQAAGAKTTNDFGVTGWDADYVWGTLVGTYRPGASKSVFDLIKPGDIIQYRDVHITSGFSTFTIPHHSAIVAANLGGGKVQLLEQNVNLERWVHDTASQDLSGIDTGMIWIYRPVAK